MRTFADPEVTFVKIQLSLGGLVGSKGLRNQNPKTAQSRSGKEFCLNSLSPSLHRYPKELYLQGNSELEMIHPPPPRICSPVCVTLFVLNLKSWMWIKSGPRLVVPQGAWQKPIKILSGERYLHPRIQMIPANNFSHAVSSSWRVEVCWRLGEGGGTRSNTSGWLQWFLGRSPFLSGHLLFLMFLNVESSLSASLLKTVRRSWVCNNYPPPHITDM